MNKWKQYINSISDFLKNKQFQSTTVLPLRSLVCNKMNIDGGMS